MIGIQAQQVSGRSVHLANILRAQYSQAKVSLPVNNGLYARLKHVQGVPSQSSTGYSLSKLQMIDLMVERLTSLRGQPVGIPRPSSEQEAGRAVESLARELHQALKGAATNLGSFASGVVESGMLIDLVA